MYIKGEPGLTLTNLRQGQIWSVAYCAYTRPRCQLSVYRIIEPRHEKPAFCICENKDADQLRGNRETDQRLCFRYTDNTIPLLFKSEISSF